MAMKLSLAAAATSIATIGMHNTVLLRGEPGVGKSSILKMLQKYFPDYVIAYVDCANLDLGDVAMPVIDKLRMVTEYAPNARFGLQRGSDRRVIIMLDELGKASRAVINMLLPLILEKRLGAEPAPLGSIVFATTNLDTDGVGDNIPAQAYNRMTEVIIGKPTTKEWLMWAADNDICPIVREAARINEEFFQSYVDIGTEKANPYIFNPLTGNIRNFVSPRSLEKASNITKARATLGDSVLPLLAGTVGEPAARMIEATMNLADQVPDYDTIVTNPEHTKVPESVGALFLLSFMMAGRLQLDDVPQIVKYVRRLAKVSFEPAALFVSTVLQDSRKLRAAKQREFTELSNDYGRYF